MTMRSHQAKVAGWLAATTAAALGSYATYAAITWLRYGHAPRPIPNGSDPLLDDFMPSFDVVERHQRKVAAPAAITLAVAGEMDLFHTPVVRTIFKARELLLGTDPDERARPRGLLADVQSMGWVVLGEIPGREIVMGAATRPWEANVTFRSIGADRFAAFAEPGYVKIAWTLRADPIGPNASIFSTETRAVATDAAAAARFRRYWAFLSPGIILIRRLSLAPLKAEAERRARGEGQPARDAELGRRRGEGTVRADASAYSTTGSGNPALP